MGNAVHAPPFTYTRKALHMAMASRKQPLYDQLVDVLREKIENDMVAHDPLPSERELSEQYGLSRTTVRLALQELESLGLVTRQHGRGTFVADGTNRVTDLSQAYSFTEEMHRLGRNPQTKVLEFGLVPAAKHASSMLRLHLGTKVFKLRRLRLADGIPMMLERSHLPASEFVSLSEHEVATKPLYDIVEKDYHQKIRFADEEFRASTARREEAELLGIPEGSPVLKLSRITFNDKNVAIEYTHSVARADQFKYKIVHRRG